MELWRARPGDVIRIPGHYPAAVTVTDSDYAGVGFNRLHWETDDEHGWTALPDETDVELLFTESPDMKVFVAAGIADREG
jgi:hypothetical protein